METWLSLHFLEQEGEPGYLSLGNLMSLDPQGTTEFAISDNNGDNLMISNKNLIYVQNALGAAEEFFVSGDRPKSVQWVENR